MTHFILKRRGAACCALTIFCIFLFFASSAHASPYKKALKKWTRSDTTYRTTDLIEIVGLKATLLSDEMIAAQARLHAKIYHLGASDELAVSQKLETKRGSGALFFVSFYGGERRFAELTNSKSGWDMRLTVGSHTYLPEQITKISTPHTPVDLMDYPYLDVWDRGYFVLFPVSLNSSSHFKLAVYGPEGGARLEWK